MRSPSRQGVISDRVSLLRGNGVGGFFGKAFEMSWMQRIYDYLQQPSDQPQSTFRVAEAADFRISAALAFYMDDSDILSIDEDAVEALSWPDFDVAMTD
jgi:hypothetical protein